MNACAAGERLRPLIVATPTVRDILNGLPKSVPGRTRNLLAR